MSSEVRRSEAPFGTKRGVTPIRSPRGAVGRPRIRRALRVPFVCLVLVALGVVGYAPAQQQDVPTREFSVGGLDAPVEILVDTWGVPHIYAEELYDVFFAQGFNAARDRLWQLDLWKRRGEGSLAEVFGPAFVDKDRAARLFLFRGDMHTEWLAYSSDTKRIVTAFVDGINAFIEQTEADPDLLPPEFDILGYRPSRWTPEAIVRIRSHGLVRNVRSEVSRAIFLREHGRDALELRERLEPAHEVQIPEGLDLEVVDEEILDVYDLATGSAELSRLVEDDTATVSSGLAPGPLAAFGASTTGPSNVPTDLLNGVGSNNWAISASKSATGRTLLANDPHRILAVPSLRYIAHLSAPGLDVIGGGEPILPGISIGHNGTAAFGLTIFGIDQEDLYVYETNPDDSTAYRYRDRWVPMKLETETIPVREGDDVTVQLKYTRHGPVVYEDPDRNLAFAVRAAWLEPGTVPYLTGLELMRARNWNEFLAAMNRWGAPAENLAYADVHGEFGFKPAGLAPRRPNWDGLLPVPGDGRYEWDGFFDMDELPVQHAPERGWVATANQMNLPRGYPRQLGYEWSAPFRFDRISEYLEGLDAVGMDDMKSLQTDYLSLPARRIVHSIEGVTAEDPTVQQALDLLRSWDFNLDRQSGAGALFEIWYRKYLGPAIIEQLVDDPATRRAVGVGDARVQIALLEAAAGITGADDEVPDRTGGYRLTPEQRDAAVLGSLARAVEDAEELLGDDWESWRWGDLHDAVMTHPASPVLDEEQRERFNVGPVSRGGSHETVGATFYRLPSFRQWLGATFRILIDVGNWDGSFALNSPGQGGAPDSEHYRDLFPLWGDDEYFPLLYSRDRVEQEAEHRIRLDPQE